MSYYSHIKRLERMTEKDKDYLFNNDWLYIQPKIDGTFGRVANINDEIICYSKRRKLDEFSGDNRGFKAYVMENKDLYNMFFNKFPEWELLGEWLVPHTIKLYSDAAWRRFYVFDVWDREEEKWVLPEDWMPHIPNGIDRIAPWLISTNEFTRNPQRIFKNYDWGFLLPEKDKSKFEGIVIKNYGTGKFAKMINPIYKEIAKKVHKPKPPVDQQSIEYKIARKYIDKHTVEKRWAEAENNIPKLLGTIYHDLIVDEIWGILKKFHNPTINFRALQAEVNKRIKELKPEVF